MRSHRYPRVSTIPLRIAIGKAYGPALLLPALAVLTAGCDRSEPAPAAAEGSSASPAAPAPSSSDAAALAAPLTATASAPAPPPAKPSRDHATLIAGGDVCMGRLLGQEIIKNPAFNPFTASARLLRDADIRFVNLESQLSEQKGETQSPLYKLVFTGPPGGAEALARARIDIVSAANNHMWDYGRAAFFETLDHLDRAKVKFAGAGRAREQAYSPAIVDVEGFRVAFLAFTDIWNQGSLKNHEAKDYVAEADPQAVSDAVKATRQSGADAVVVSYHGGEEYVSMPLQRAVDLHHGAIDAGADAVIGHHPHVAQGVEIYKGKPIFYSLGNYLMRTHGTHLETGIGFLARITFARGKEPQAWLCPFRIEGVVPSAIPLADDKRRELYEGVSRQRIRLVQGSIASPALIGPSGEDGCSTVTEKK